MPISGEECNKAINNVFNYLNDIDLMTYLKEFNYKNIDELMERLEKDFSYKDKYSESLFDVIAEDEFVDYLNNRYKLRIKESTKTYYRIYLD